MKISYIFATMLWLAASAGWITWLPIVAAQKWLLR